MTKVLIIDDHLEMIEKLSQILLRMRATGSLVFRFATSFEEAKKRLLAEPFDVVVADVMLPNQFGLLPNEEGIYLVAWILGHDEKLPASLKDCKRPAWLTKKNCRPVFLTSRMADTVRDACRQLVGRDADDIPIIERLRGNTYDQAKEILEIADSQA